MSILHMAILFIILTAALLTGNAPWSLSSEAFRHPRHFVGNDRSPGSLGASTGGSRVNFCMRAERWKSCGAEVMSSSVYCNAGQIVLFTIYYIDVYMYISIFNLMYYILYRNSKV